MHLLYMSVVMGAAQRVEQQSALWGSQVSGAELFCGSGGVAGERHFLQGSKPPWHGPFGGHVALQDCHVRTLELGQQRQAAPEHCRAGLAFVGPGGPDNHAPARTAGAPGIEPTGFGRVWVAPLMRKLY